jgi:branched-chain amino acid aminotransferase
VYGGGGIRLITSSVRRFPPDCLDPKVHHCNLIQSILAKIQANQAGADDALMLDVRGFVAETNATHVFVVERDEWRPADAWDGVNLLTPTCAACPEGITRAAVLELCAAYGISCQVRDVSLTEVYRAAEVFCTGTMGELVSVAQVDGRKIGSGPVTARLQALYRDMTAREGTVVVDSSGSA